MPERRITPEALEKMLPEAVEEVKGLYLGDEISNLYGTQSLEQRDKFWEETASRFKPFSEEIGGLREALKTAYVTERAYDERVKNLMRSHFSGVGDVGAQELLTHILYVRTSCLPGYVVTEVEAMIKELGVRGGLRDKALKKITLDYVIKRVLMGDLKLSRQTQLEEK